MTQTRGQALNDREGDRLAKLLRNFKFPHLENYIKEIMEKIITKYLEVFTLEDEPLPCTNLTEHEITLKSGEIVNLKSHRLPEKHKEFSLTKTDTLLSKGIIRDNHKPFRLRNAPATFQRMMGNAFRGLIGKNCFAYIDDIVVLGKTLQQHNQNLELVLDKIEKLGLKLEPTKCKYLKPELEYLGYLITKDGVKLNPLKIKAIKKFIYFKLKIVEKHFILYKTL